MGANDVPPVEKQKAAEVRKMKSPSSDKLDSLITKIKQNGTKDAAVGPTLTNEGQISKMTLPAGWSRSAEQPKASVTSNYVEFHSEKNPTAKLGTYYRGHRISPLAGKRFHELLKAPPHELTSAEYLSLEEVLRDKAKAADFKVASKKTVSIGGKTVLLVEGKFNEIKQDAYAIYVDAEGSGEVVQEIFYQAPESQYSTNLKAAEETIKSIVWK